VLIMLFSCVPLPQMWDCLCFPGKTASNIFGGVHPNLGDYYSYTGAGRDCVTDIWRDRLFEYNTEWVWDDELWFYYCFITIIYL